MGCNNWSLAAKQCEDSALLCRPCDAEIHTCAACDGDIHSAVAAERFSEEEAEAASWILPDPNIKPENYLFGGVDSYPGPGPGPVPGKHKAKYEGAVNDEEKQICSDEVLPVQRKIECGSGRYLGPVVDGFPAYDVGYPGCKPFIMYNFTSQCISQSVSSTSFDVGEVPEHNAAADVSKAETEIPTRVFGADREARVLRYREKRKNRKFEKTVRYASRKAYAETRPRVKGRFAKRSDNSSSYGVVPAF